MGTKYFCAHCDEEFTPEQPEAKPRCPRCMRRSGVEPVSEAPVPSASGRRASIIALVALAIVALGYAAYRYQSVALEETPPSRPLDAAELAAYLERDQIDAGVHGAMFSLPASVEGWPVDPNALTTELHKESSRWSLERALPRPVFSADETLAALQASEERVELYPLELAVAMTALLRAQGVDAMVAEVWAFGEGEAPPDPSGMLGYFVCAVLTPATNEPAAFYDPWGGRGEVSPSALRVLRDTEVVGAALGIEAVRVFARSGDGGEALPMVETALRLDPLSPSLRVVHATVLVESGGVPQALQELGAAVELRRDAPRELNMAQLKLAEAGILAANGEGGAAEVALAEANRIVTGLIERSPRYGRAHLTLATIHLGLSDLDRARIELETAERLSPGSPMLWAAWAQYHLAVEEFDAAATTMNRAIALDPENWQLRLQAAGVLRAAGDAEAARKNGDEALRLVTPERRNELRSYIDQMMGPARLELPDPAPSGAGGAEGAGNKPALMLGDPSKLRLRGADEKLQLDLDE
jgi:tetratricopeptide (TPR) repeat protein/DNA-directed RNA polymerase subunit RPC12/RpoP